MGKTIHNVRGLACINVRDRIRCFRIGSVFIFSSNVGQNVRRKIVYVP